MKLVCVIASLILLLGIISAVGAADDSSEPTLRSAKIIFIMPEGDDKDDDTAVSVSVSSRFNDQFDVRLAYLDNFANTGPWEDTGGKSYTYELNCARGLKLSQIDKNVKTKISINPVGNDTVKFGYRLILTFDDDDPTTAPTEITQERSDIVLSQDNRTFTS